MKKTVKINKTKSIEERLKSIEDCYPKPAGTQLVRVLAPYPEEGIQWALWIGQMENPHNHMEFRGGTIEDVLSRAESCLELFKKTNKMMAKRALK